MNDYTQLPLPFPPETIEIELSKGGKKNANMHTAIIDAIDAEPERQRIIKEHKWDVDELIDKNLELFNDSQKRFINACRKDRK